MLLKLLRTNYPNDNGWFLIRFIRCHSSYSNLFFDDEFCKLQKIKKRTLKIARRKETGKISDESFSQIRFLGSENVSISFCSRCLIDFDRDARFRLVIVICNTGVKPSCISCRFFTSGLLFDIQLLLSYIQFTLKRVLIKERRFIYLFTFIRVSVWGFLKICLRQILKWIFNWP